MAVGRLHAAVGLERSGRGVHERGTGPERVPDGSVLKMLHLRRFCSTLACNIPIRAGVQCREGLGKTTKERKDKRISVAAKAVR